MADLSPDQQLLAFLAKYERAIAKVAKESRGKLRRLLPGAVELVYDNYNALVIAFSSSDRASDIICSIAMYPKWVSLFFMRGADLADPTGLLQGGGKQIRHVVLESAATLAAPAVRRLLAEAVAGHPKLLTASTRRRTIIKSVSAKQRPRRPSKQRGRTTRG